MNDYSFDSKFLTQIFSTKESKIAEWFGYYNYDVLSTDGKKMLCNRASFDGRAITESDTVELGYFEIETGEYHRIATTDSFNWQQGAMLQWLPGSDDTVVYNFSDKKHFKSAIYNIDTGEKKIIDFPIYCITPNGKYSVSLNYERSYWCRAYHYESIKNEEYDVRVANNDGVFLVDLQDNTVKRIIDIKDIINMAPEQDFNSAKHWLEHVMVSPSGNRIAFLHRYSYGNAYSTRVFISDIDGQNLQVIHGWKNFEWSHFGWCGENAFAIYTVRKTNAEASYAKIMQKKRSVKRNIVKFIHRISKLVLPKKVISKMKANSSYYQFYEFKNEKFELKENFDSEEFAIDGHPNFINGKYMITDSYPDKDNYQRLMIYNKENKKTLTLGRFYAFYKGNPASCDLHPKISKNCKFVAVDTAYSGIHNMIVFEINWGNVVREIG